jgi:hypothetical protein
MKVKSKIKGILLILTKLKKMWIIYKSKRKYVLFIIKNLGKKYKLYKINNYYNFKFF